MKRSIRPAMVRVRTSLVCTAVALAIATSSAQLAAAAQTQTPTDATAPTYEVTSVKINPKGDPNKNITWDETPDGLRVENVTLELLIRQAYDLRSYQIERAPEWAGQDEFDISAKADDAEVRHLQTLPKDQATAERRLMLQALLAERFRLAAHRETKQGTVYALVIAKNGPKFQEATPPPPPRMPISMGAGLLTFNGAPMPTLARLISQVINAPVVDHTGLNGKYEFTLKWTPDEFDLPTVAQQPDNTSSEPAGTSIFTVLQDQLGLKLEATKGPMEVLIIDHIDPPTPN